MRCLAQRPEVLTARVGSVTEVVAGDVFDGPSLLRAMTGMQIAYYLVHSLGATGAFEPADGQAAHNFGAAAREAGVRRVIYLGGLEDCRGGLSAHWHSGQEVEDILRAYDVQVIQFRASIIIGSGRLSFEMIRALVEQLPVMRTPRWVASPALPVAMSDVVRYLLAALDLARASHQTFEVDGADRVSYGELIANMPGSVAYSA